MKRTARTTEQLASPAWATAPQTFLNSVFSDCSALGWTLWHWALRHPIAYVRTLRAVLRLPTLSAELPAGAEAAAVAKALHTDEATRRATLGVVAALRTPASPGTFSVGPDRGTLRRKMRAAAKQGISIRPVAPEDRPALLALANRHEQQNSRAQYRNASPQNDDLLGIALWLAAYGESDSPLMLAVIPIAGAWAVLRYFRTLEPGTASSDARYLMTDALAEELGRRDVHFLVDSARPHWLPNGLRHFQQMVGFRLIRLRSIRVLAG